MKILKLLIISLALTLVSCTNKNKTTDESAGTESVENQGLESVEGDEIVLDDSADDIDLLAEDDAMNKKSEPATEVVNEVTDTSLAEEVVIADDSSPAITMTDEFASYTVGSGETLMMIAFKVYGDYRKWKDIQSLNNDTLSGTTVLNTGMQIKYKVPAQKFVWNPEGNPYLIKRGDTLVLISGDVYGKTDRWRDIWDNNRPLIRDPNLIFAGFTLYYIPGDKPVALK